MRLLGSAAGRTESSRISDLRSAFCAVWHLVALLEFSSRPLYIVYDTLMSKVPARTVPNGTRQFPIFALIVVLLFAAVPALHAAKTLEIYSIDTEGGQATLLVSPSGQTLLIDTGYAGNSGRDADRIAAAAKASGVKKIDYLLLTHHHSDHAGGVHSLLERLPVANFLDHGPDVENGNQYDSAYAAAFAKGSHQVVKAGDTIPVKGLDIKVVVASGKPLDHKGESNPYCAGLTPKEGETGENPQSAGILVQFGKFRFADLGDILYTGELALECPENKLGKADVYLTTHHATHVPPKSVYGVAPRVIVMNNGPRKGGLPEAWKLLHDSPGLEDLWQLHFAVAGGKDTNAPDAFIANVDERDLGQYLKITASEDGSFTVFNQRNKFSKAYKAK
jgi:competence protein ComEC